MRDDLAGVVLAAGAGARLRPLTDQLPKALVPVGTVPLLDGALARLSAALELDHHDGDHDGDQDGDHDGDHDGGLHLAVNAHAHADLVAAAVLNGGSGGRPRAHLSREDGGPASTGGPAPALGTAGALGALRDWLDGRGAVVTNADVWTPPEAGAAALRALVGGWDGERCRLLCEPAPPGSRADFRTPDGAGVRYTGSCVLPWSLLAPLEPVPTGLYEVLWRDLDARGLLDLAVVAPVDGWTAVDCGTPADYLRANLLATGGRSAVSPGAVVRGSVDRCVVWPGAVVERGEHLVEVVRAGTEEAPVTVPVVLPVVLSAAVVAGGP